MNTININNVKNICIPNCFPENPKYFTEESISHMFALPQGKPPIGSILSIVIDTEILSQRLVPTNIGVSNEGIINPGYKLIISIKFKEKIRYSARECEESINMLHLESEIYSFSISLPCKINGIDTCALERRQKLKVIPYIEDIYTELIGPCNILQSITFFLHGIVK